MCRSIPKIRRLYSKSTASVVNERMIDYVLPRRMGGPVVGIGRGLAVHYDEADRSDVMPTTNEDGERVRIHVRRR